METAAKIASIISAACGTLTFFWNIVLPAVRKMRGAAPNEASPAPPQKRQLLIMVFLVFLCWVPIAGLWLFGGPTTKGTGAAIRLKMGDAFRQRRVESKMNMSGEYPWVFPDGGKEDFKRLWWVFVFDRPFDSGSIELSVNGKEADRSTYYLKDKTDHGVVINTLAYSNDDLIEIKIPAKE
jgi:hypothetical protein